MNERMRKVNSTMVEVVAQCVAALKDPRIGFVTVTAVDTSPNLRKAVVYYSVLGTPEEVALTAEGLASAAPLISRSVGAQSSMKYTPSLRFQRDMSAERSASLTQIFNRLDNERDGASIAQDKSEPAEQSE